MIGHIEHERHYLCIKIRPQEKTRSCNVKDVVHELPIKLWNIDTQFAKARKNINHPINLPTLKLSD